MTGNEAEERVGFFFFAPFPAASTQNMLFLCHPPPPPPPGGRERKKGRRSQEREMNAELPRRANLWSGGGDLRKRGATFGTCLRQDLMPNSGEGADLCHPPKNEKKK